MKYKEENLTQFIKNYLGGDLALAKVQRELIWDSRNVIQLLDSICRGIPMGTVIFGRGQTNAKDAEKREPHPVSNPALIIYDGQQRMLSLKNVFVHDKFYFNKDRSFTASAYRVWVDVDNFYSAINSEGKRGISAGETKQNKNPFLLSFKNGGAECGCYPFEIIPDGLSEEKLFPFVLFGQLIEDNLSPIDRYKKTGEDIQKFVKAKRVFGRASVNWLPLSSILGLELKNRGCSPKVIEKATAISTFINQKMDSYKICICEIGGDSDVDNLFLRINRSGKLISDDEQYLAKLRQRWPEVEQALARLHGEGTPFDLLGVIRLVVLLARNIEINPELKRDSRGVNLQPQLRHFNESILLKIKKVLEKKEQIEVGIKSFTASLSKAGLSYGIHLIDKKLLVVAMASVISDIICDEQKELPAEGSQSWRHLARYLFVIDQSGVLSSQANNTHLRKIFKTLWYARFPQSLQFRDEFDKRCNQKLKTEPLLWLSIIQQIPFDRLRYTFDIDHIVPLSWKKKKGIKTELKNAIERNPGNMWIVQRRLIKEWPGVSPGQKFSLVDVNSDISFGCSLETMRVDREKFDSVKDAADLVDTKNADTLRSAIEDRARELKRAVLDCLGL